MPVGQISNPFGVNAPQGNEVYLDRLIIPCAADPAGFTSTISGVSTATAAVITTSAAHGLSTGQSVTISGLVMTGTPQSHVPSGTYKVTWLSTTTFSIPVDTTGLTYASGGTAIAPLIIGTPVEIQGWDGTNSSNTAASLYPTVAPASATSDTLGIGVVLSGGQGGSDAAPIVGGIVQVCVSGLCRVSVDSTVAIGNNLIQSAASKGQLKSGTAAASKNYGVVIQAVTVTGTPLLARAWIKMS